MILVCHTSRICRNLSCHLAVSKVSVAYSNGAVPRPKPRALPPEPPCVSVADNCRGRFVGGSCATISAPTEIIVPSSVPNDVRQKARKPQEPEWKLMEVDGSKLRDYCLALSKIRLTSLVVVTTMGGYALAPGPFDVATFLACSLGTGLVSATANSVNQFFEVPFDAQMSRTKNRVLVRGRLTPAHAVIFAAASGVAGLTLLYTQVNGTTALLGVANLILYTLIYTPMKRVSILNTWVGSVVGAIPPLMGWAACVGDVISPGAWIMSGILYAWQFPHFNALSWNLRPDYSRAGYRMMAVTNPNLCRATALRYTAILTALCYLAPALDVTNWWFALGSTPLNAYFLYLSWNFYRHSDSGSSRKLFRFSLLHLPMLMLLMLLSKKYWFSAKNQDNGSPQGVMLEAPSKSITPITAT